MRDITCFSANTLAQFENNYDNMLQFNELLVNTSNGVHTTYSVEEANTMIRNQADKILGINWATATPTKRRQAWREHGKEFASLLEDVLIDKMVSGIPEDSKFMDFVEEKNISLGDVNEFYVNDNSLMQVSKFAGNHHDIVRQAMKPGKAYRVDTSWYAIKVYTDFELFRTGRIDFAAMVNRMYDSISKYRMDALYTAFLSMGDSLPTDMYLRTAAASTTVDAIVGKIEAVKAATGREVMLVGTKVALTKLQGLVNYNMWSDSMKDERNKNGVLGTWEGYECLALPRVNAQGTRTEISDNTKILIVPIDPEFKPIKRVIEGDVMYTESGTDGSKKDMTMDVEIAYMEGTAIVINQLFGYIQFTA